MRKKRGEENERKGKGRLLVRREDQHGSHSHIKIYFKAKSCAHTRRGRKGGRETD